MNTGTFPGFQCGDADPLRSATQMAAAFPDLLRWQEYPLHCRTPRHHRD